MRQEEVDEAFRTAHPIIGRRLKTWEERTWKEKFLFWTRPDIYDSELMNKILKQVSERPNWFVDILPAMKMPEDSLISPSDWRK